jgi:DNA-binding response OmpR family regulator
MAEGRSNPPDPVQAGDKDLVQCGSCGKYYRIHPEKLPHGVASFNCRSCGSVIPLELPRDSRRPGVDARTVLVAVSEDDLGLLVVKILTRHGFEGIVAPNGEEALRITSEESPDAALISVVLPDILGYEVIDRMAEIPGGKSFPIILLSSIHRGTRYKRAPTSYYGADDHIERHHLPDLLVPKLNRLLEKEQEQGPLKAGPEMIAAQTDEDVDDIRKIEEMHQETSEATGDPDEKELRRMCRVIVGDIALYNEDVIKETSPEDLLTRLAGDLSEGEQLLRDKYPDFGGNYSQVLQEEMSRLLNSRAVSRDR